MFKKIVQKIRGINSEKRLNVNNTDAPKAVYTNEPKLKKEWLSGNIEMWDIPNVFQILLTSDIKIKLQVAKILNYNVNRLSPIQLVKVDSIFRQRGSREWACEWRNKEPKDLIEPLMSDQEKITILGLSSFNPSGCFRENAIRNISNMRTGHEIPYLLIRLNDWSSQVRNISKEKLLNYMLPIYAKRFVDNLLLVLRLCECSRDKHDDVIKAIITLLSSTECSQNVIDGLQSIDPKARLACYKIILQTGILDNKSIISCLIEESNPYNRIFVLKNIKNHLTSAEFTDISHLMIHDKFPRIRTLIIENFYEFKAEGYIDILEKSVFDKNQSVSYTARYLLSKHKRYDFVVIYRDAIKNNEQLYASICGLGEVGKSEDSNIIIKFLNSPEIKIVKASMNALVRLNFEGHKEEIIEKLGDGREGISKVAKRILYKEIHAGDAESLYRIYKESTFKHTKINCCCLLLSINKWTAIRYIIEFCAEENEIISKLGKRDIAFWNPKHDYPYIRPSKKQIEELKMCLNRFGKFIEDRYRVIIESNIREVEQSKLYNL